MVCGNFTDIAIRMENGVLLENYILLELWRTKQPGMNIWFYRTLDGVEVDFGIDDMNVNSGS